MRDVCELNLRGMLSRCGRLEGVSNSGSERVLAALDVDQLKRRARRLNRLVRLVSDDPHRVNLDPGGGRSRNKCIRESDGAELYFDESKGGFVVVKDGKIVTYYPPTRGFD